MQYTIPRCLWESLDAVLHSKCVSLAKEIAKELSVSPQPLIAFLNEDERGKFTIIPDEDNTYQCKALVHRSATLMRCRNVTLDIGSGLCSSHEKCLPEVPANLPSVQRLVTSESTYMVSEGLVYSLSGQQCGHFKNGKCILFEIEE